MPGLLGTETSVALLLYDYTLTIVQEIELFWRRPKKSWMFALFVANRYISILGHAQSGVYEFWSPVTPSNYSVGLVVAPYSILYLTCIHIFPEFSGELVTIYSPVGCRFTWHILGVNPYKSLTNS